MSGSPNRRKFCELEIQKQAYLRHISRLQQLKDGLCYDQIQRCRQQKKLAQAITRVRKMHECNRQFKLKQLKEIQLQSIQTDFKKVKSVVVNDFNWTIPSVAPKHQRNIKPILNQNIKLFERIISTKANVNSRNFGYTERKNKDLPCLSSADFSKLYEKSRLSVNPYKIIKIRLGKSKNNSKTFLEINLRQLFQYLKDKGSMYILQIACGNMKGRSEAFILQELQISNIMLKAPLSSLSNRYVTAKLIKILDNHEKKQIIKARLFGETPQQLQKIEQQSQKLRVSSSCQLENPKNEENIQKKVKQKQQSYKRSKKTIIKLKLQRQHKFSLNTSRQRAGFKYKNNQQEQLKSTGSATIKKYRNLDDDTSSQLKTSNKKQQTKLIR